MKYIFPKEIIDSTAEAHQFKHSSKSMVIYIIILLFITLTFVALPLIKVSVYNTSRGIIKPNKNRVSLTLISPGEILMFNMKNNQDVNRGDTLLILNNSILKESLSLLVLQKEETNTFINDLEYLINNKKTNFKKIITHRYQKDYLSFTQTNAELQTQFEKSKRDYNRNLSLYEKGVIAKVEYENSKFQFDVAVNDLKSHRVQQINSWQLELTNFNKEIEELSSANKRLEQDKKKHVLIAPIKGTLLNIKGITRGLFISQGVELGEISPDTELIAECYISPSDIGLLNKDKVVSFQIDTFNYNQWGLVYGEIIEIGNDIVIVDNSPVFKIRCKVNTSYLQLKNGFKGHLKKGMTLNARFELTERTLFNLLYDKVDNWMNPGMK